MPWKNCLLAAAMLACAARAQPPIAVRVVVVTMFERGADTGDEPGEFQYWVERENLLRVFPFPQGYHHLRINRSGVLGVVTGVGAARAAATIMALGLDPRFDLSHAYWLVDGIGGWKTGYVPLRRSLPYEQPRRDQDAGEVYHLDPSLVDWAYRLTKEVRLADNDSMRARREQFPEANARRPPFVLKGDTIPSMTFWHGKLLSQWAGDWVKYHTGGKGNYVTCAMEDTGTLQALTFLARAGRVNRNRVLVLRTASNFDQQRPGITAAESLAETKIGQYSACLPALDAAWRVDRVVVEEITGNRTNYRDKEPGR